LYASQEVSLPVGCQLIAKTETYLDQKTQKEKRRRAVSKHESGRGLIKQAVDNHRPFRVVWFDVWCASAENRRVSKHEQTRDFSCPLKTNRKVALRVEAKLKGRYTRVATLDVEATAPRKVYLEGVDFPRLLAKQVFTNEDGRTGILSLVSSATTLTFDDLTTTSQKRWQGECSHKSLKQTVSLEKSPPQTATTQTNHFFAALCGLIKLELRKVDTKLNHFALKSKLYINALHSAFSTLRELSPPQFAA
jgi:hypothetical protein